MPVISILVGLLFYGHPAKDHDSFFHFVILRFL
jgi:hypothetical protein